MSKLNKQLTYERAYAELSKILQIIQDHEVSLEDLTGHLRRAKELILFCEQRLHITETELKTIFTEEEE